MPACKPKASCEESVCHCLEDSGMQCEFCHPKGSGLCQSGPDEDDDGDDDTWDSYSNDDDDYEDEDYDLDDEEDDDDEVDYL